MPSRPKKGSPIPANDAKHTTEFPIPAGLLRDSVPLSTEFGLLVPVGGNASEDILIGNEEAILGRVPGMTVQLQDPSVSRRHARVFRRDDEYVLEDLDSSHGTHVDGVPIVSCLLRDGDVVQVGRSVFCFRRQVQYAPPRSTMGIGT